METPTTWTTLLSYALTLLIGSGGGGLIAAWLQRETIKQDARNEAARQITESWKLLSDEQSERIQTLHNDIEGLQLKVKVLIDELSATRHELASTKSRMVVLEQAVLQRDERIDELERVEASQSQELEILHNRIGGLTQENTKLKHERDRLEHRVHELEDKVKYLQTKLGEL